MFNLVEKVLNNNQRYNCYSAIEQIRCNMMKDQRKIQVTDFGTGTSGARRIATIARRVRRAGKYGELLFRLAEYFKPRVILELGTSLGISTAYLASSGAKVISLEGCPETAGIARQNLNELGLNNVEVRVGDFSETLPEVLRTHQPEMVFFDGNHRKDPTLRYFHLCKAQRAPRTVFIVDDIHWSQEMCEAWEEIQRDPEVKVTVDLFYMGLVFFEPGLSKEDFILKY
ncbi:MAG: class I SAM-dependent methyltransferase [Bacteroidia bacterium]|nr:class I SAM-dependent methyltransferase [Bacteroidia bacterium]